MSNLCALNTLLLVCYCVRFRTGYTLTTPLGLVGKIDKHGNHGSRGFRQM